jgi:hypothetical protein
MDNQNIREMARAARDLYRLAGEMQKIMLRMFFDEFCELDVEEQKIFMEGETMPF